MSKYISKEIQTHFNSPYNSSKQKSKFYSIFDSKASTHAASSSVTKSCLKYQPLNTISTFDNYKANKQKKLTFNTLSTSCLSAKDKSKFNKSLEKRIIKKYSKYPFLKSKKLKNLNQDDIDNGPTIIIKETEGNQLNNGSIEINAGGCEIGSRKAKDGVTLFGPILTDEKNIIINDILIAPNFKDINSHLFVIYYKKEERKYYIRTYKDQFSNGLSVLLVKINKYYPIKKSEMFMIGDLFFVFKVHVEKNIKNISITKLSCKRSPDEEKKTFDSESVLKEGNKITIGRDKKCTMSYSSDKSFSKIHSTIYYNKSKEMWEIQDGTDEKTSTNGVWVIPKHSMEIFDNMNFKIMGCSKFVINLYNK